MYSSLGPKSELSLSNKLLHSKMILSAVRINVVYKREVQHPNQIKKYCENSNLHFKFTVKIVSGKSKDIYTNFGTTYRILQTSVPITRNIFFHTLSCIFLTNHLHYNFGYPDMRQSGTPVIRTMFFCLKDIRYVIEILLFIIEFLKMKLKIGNPVRTKILRCLWGKQ